MYPSGPCTAYLALGMAPGNPLKLEATVRQAGKTMDDVKLFKGGRGTALEVPMIPTPTEKPLEMFKGWGVVPLPPLNNLTLPIGMVTSSMVFPACLTVASSFTGLPGAIPKAR